MSLSGVIVSSIGGRPRAILSLNIDDKHWVFAMIGLEDVSTATLFDSACRRQCRAADQGVRPRLLHAVWHIYQLAGMADGSVQPLLELGLGLLCYFSNDDVPFPFFDEYA